MVNFNCLYIALARAGPGLKQGFQAAVTAALGNEMLVSCQHGSFTDAIASPRHDDEPVLQFWDLPYFSASLQNVAHQFERLNARK